MNKGCVIAAVVVGVIVVVCAGVTIYFSTKFVNPSVLVVFETGIDSYQQKHPDANIELTNEAWVTALTAPDSGVEPDIAKAIKQTADANGGKFADIYQTPVNLAKREDGTIQVLSAGKDKTFGTADDENTDPIKKLMK